ncbi:MAG: hypothetical protein Q8O67_24555 [Deltaproteobacteria bacterium]|nr:hypothetical protein [Deltaproteobacteria bacterium]
MFVVVVAFVVAGLPLELPVTPAEPASFDNVVTGGLGTFPGADLAALERSVGDAGSLILRVGNAVAEPCSAAPVDLPSQVLVSRRLLAAAVVEAARGRSGASMAVSASADLAVAVAACPPQTNEGQLAARAIALQTVATAKYLVARGGLDAVDVRGVARDLRPIVADAVDVLLLPIKSAGPLVEGSTSLRCRKKGDLTVLSESEGRAAATMFQSAIRSVIDLPILPTFGSSMGVQLALRQRPTDDFLRSCGFVDGDVLITVNGKSVSSPEQLLHVHKLIANDRRAVVVVRRQGAQQTVVVDEEHGG